MLDKTEDDFLYEMLDGIEAVESVDVGLSKQCSELIAQALIKAARATECIADYLEQDNARRYAAAEKRNRKKKHKNTLEEWATLAKDPDHRIAADREEAAILLRKWSNSQRSLADQLSTGQLRFRHSERGRPRSYRVRQEEIELALSLYAKVKITGKRYCAVAEVSVAEGVSKTKLNRIWTKFIKRKKSKSGTMYYVLKI